jgi:peptidoglycan lytic transglycosylase
VTASAHRILRTTSLPIVAGAALAAAVGCFSWTALLAQAGPPPAAPGAAAEASRALEEGRPYRATRLLAPLVSGTGPGDPEVVLLAARAAAGWDGWGTVVRLLGTEPWLDGRESGEGRALLARARLERGDPAALEDAAAAVRSAPAEALGSRLVTLGRALDRADQLDSAARVYLRAAGALPSISSWLRLRAAGVTRDSAARAALYREVSLPAAIPRSRWTEAIARERSGDFSGAARAYEALGSTLAAVRLRLKSEPDSATRAAARRDLLALLGPRGSADDAREAIALLDGTFGALTREEELVVARRAAVTGPFPRAVQGFAHAAAAKPLTPEDRLEYGGALDRLGRHKEAIAVFATVRTRPLRPRAEYQRARSLLAMGRRPDAIAALRKVAAGLRYDTATASTAGFLAAELRLDDGDDAKARKEYLEVARRFPRTSHGARAALQAGLLAYVQGDAKGAANELAALADRPAGYGETPAALYWTGRALLAAGDSAGARLRWRAVRDRYATSYYAIPAAERLGAPPVVLAPPGEPPPTDSAAEAALQRGALLEGLGLRVEARFEYDQVARGAEGTPASLLAGASEFASHGLTARAYRLAGRAADRLPADDVLLQRLLFPLPHRDALLHEARDAGVDPLLAAAIIRQESAFDPGAHSAADARGLMQVLPSVGASLARSEGIRDWDPALLNQPELNLHFGMTHLAQMLRRFPRLEAALAAYNAGGKPADEWLTRKGVTDDPELFIERVQYVETRDYIRRILRNLAVYRVLYPALP